MARLFAEQGDRVAAVITEPVQGAGGVRPPVTGYLEGLRRLCDQHGAFLIMDEVICGFGRLGHWFGSEHYGIRPDLITFAKGVSSGYVPIGGVVVGSAVRQPLEADETFMLRHGHTYSGHATACAAAMAALDITEADGLLERAGHVGDRLSEGLVSLAADGVLAEVRGDVAVWAAGLPPDRDAIAVRDHMLDLGVITRAIGTDTLSFCPPLVIADSEIDRIVDAPGGGTEVGDGDPGGHARRRRRPAVHPVRGGHAGLRRDLRRRRRPADAAAHRPALGHAAGPSPIRGSGCSRWTAARPPPSRCSRRPTPTSTAPRWPRCAASTCSRATGAGASAGRCSSGRSPRPTPSATGTCGCGCWRPTCGLGGSTPAGGWFADGAERPVPGVATRATGGGVFELRYRKPRSALTAAAGASSVSAIEIDDVYDPETLARIEAAGPAEPGERPRPVRRVRQRGAAGVLAAAMMMGLREVFDPPQHSEIEQVDPWEGGGTNPRVRVHLDPDPRQTIAEVRDL